MDSTLNEILHYFVILIILKCQYVTCDKFGCKISNDTEYNALFYSPNWYTNNYGTYVQPMEFFSLGEIETLRTNMDNINKNILRYFASNDLNDFLRFYSDYNLKKDDGISLGTFFESYKLKYKVSPISSSFPLHNRPAPHGLELEFLEQLIQSNGKLKDHVYLAAVSRGDSCENEKCHLMKGWRLGSRNENNFYYNVPRYAAGVLKFIIDKNRVGYIINHSSVGLTRPIIIMEDSLPPHEAATQLNYVDERYTNKYYTSLLYNTNGYSQILRIVLHVDRDDPKSCAPYIYSVQCPFCSFITFMGRQKFLSKHFSIQKQHTDGRLLAQIKFSLADKLRFYLQEGFNDEKNGLNISYHSSDLDTLNEEEKIFLATVLNQFNMTTGDLKTKMDAFQSILDDKPFRDDLDKIRNHWTEIMVNQYQMDFPKIKPNEIVEEERKKKNGGCFTFFGLKRKKSLKNQNY